MQAEVRLYAIEDAIKKLESSHYGAFDLNTNCQTGCSALIAEQPTVTEHSKWIWHKKSARTFTDINQDH